MGSSPKFASLILALIGCFLIAFPASAAERPVKQNRSYNPAARPDAFSFVTTGLTVKIKSATIAADGTITARFTVTDSKGAGLDVNGVQTAGLLSLRFIAAYIPNGQSQYVAYTTAVDKAVMNNNPSQVQASTDSGGKFTLVDSATGTYDYTFGTRAPSKFDPTATHSIGMTASRDLSAYDFPSPFTADDVYTFVPDGSPVTHVRDIVNEAACNQCHNPLATHGGARHKTALCITCHTPQSVNPDTLNTVDFKVFIHKLHMGSSLPSVKAGGQYFIFHRGAPSDFSTVVFPQDIRNCTTCHAAGPAQADNWKTNPSRAVCGSCHEDVNFATGQNHVNLPQFDDNQCKNCHAAQASYDFDASIPGAHVVPNNSTSLPGVNLQIMSVNNATPGSAPAVTFKASDNAGNPLDISKFASMRVVLGGPNTDYGTGPGGVRVSEDPTKTQGANGVYTYQMTNKIPAAATGSYTVSLEASKSVMLMDGTSKATAAIDSAMPVRNYFSVDNNPMTPRRQVVATDKCATCHQKLTFVHGGNRANAMECPICHNPTLSDGTSKQSVDMPVQIHSIHRGENLTKPYILGTTNFQEVRFPGDLRDCTTCHLPGTYQVDNVGATAMVASPGGWMPQTGPIAAACQGCHDDKATASHALANTTALGESCVACHGQNAEFAVDKVHARTY